jgi:hypothetical protein
VTLTTCQFTRFLFRALAKLVPGFNKPNTRESLRGTSLAVSFPKNQDSPELNLSGLNHRSHRSDWTRNHRRATLGPAHGTALSKDQTARILIIQARHDPLVFAVQLATTGIKRAQSPNMHPIQHSSVEMDNWTYCPKDLANAPDSDPAQAFHKVDETK